MSLMLTGIYQVGPRQMWSRFIW